MLLFSEVNIVWTFLWLSSLGENVFQVPILLTVFVQIFNVTTLHGENSNEIREDNR